MNPNTTIIDSSSVTIPDDMVLIGNNSTANIDFIYTPYMNYDHPNSYGVNMWASNTLQGNSNVYIGYNAGCNTTSGNYNYYIGWDAGYRQKTIAEIKRESRKDKLAEIFGDDI